MLNKENYAEKADTRLESIIAAIKNKDKESLKSIFSKQAINEAEDLDGRMDYLFDFVQGNVISTDTVVHGNIDESADHGVIERVSRS